MRKAVLSTIVLAMTCGTAMAQQQMPMSPRGTAATQVAGKWVEEKAGEAPAYRDGKWVVIDYGRPILRGRTNIWGSGADYGKTLLAGTPVWRAGANATTRLRTEAPLVFGTTTVAPGEYSVFIDLKPGAWTFILSSQPVAAKWDPNEKVATSGSYNYDPKYDLVRVPMRIDSIPFTIDQLTFGFVDVTERGGTLGMWWGTQQAMVDFRIGG
jgi:Ni/Co efflux regulator RcnB